MIRELSFLRLFGQMSNVGNLTGKKRIEIKTIKNIFYAVEKYNAKGMYGEYYRLPKKY